MDVIAMKDLLIGAAAVLGAGLAIWNFLQSPSKENSASITSMNKRVDDHDRRIQSVEGELRHLPDQEAVHELKLAIVELQGTVRALDVQLSAVGRTVANIDGYLRKEDGK